MKEDSRYERGGDVSCGDGMGNDGKAKHGRIV